MSPKFFYLYFVGGTLALILEVYQLVANYPNVNFATVLLYLIPALLLYYMAYKVYHVKKDGELM